MDSMHQPRQFPRVFIYSYLYVFTLTLPSAATTFAAFPTQAALHGTAPTPPHPTTPHHTPPHPTPPRNNIVQQVCNIGNY